MRNDKCITAIKEDEILLRIDLSFVDELVDASRSVVKSPLLLAAVTSAAYLDWYNSGTKAPPGGSNFSMMQTLLMFFPLSGGVRANGFALIT